MFSIGYWGETHEGNVRKVNEDGFEGLMVKDTLFLVVADGFGIADGKDGQPAGSVAVNEIRRYIEQYYAGGGHIEYLKGFLNQCIYSANRVVCAYKKANFDLFSGFGCSVSIAAITANKGIVVAHAGNTRVNLMRAGKIYQATVDHTQAQKLLDENKITKDQYFKHPERLILTNGLGAAEDIKIDVLDSVLATEDFVILLTDGIYNLITDEEIRSLIIGAGNLEGAAKALINGAKERGGFDNATALLTYIRF